MHKFKPYSRFLTWSAVFLLSAALTACGGASSTTTSNSSNGNSVGNDPAASGPMVMAVTPLNKATTVAGNTTIITAAFSEAMSPTTINASSFSVSCKAPCVSPAGSVSYVAASNTAEFTPKTPLTAGMSYTVSISSAVTDMAGDPLASDYVWSFTVAIPAPVVDSVTPSKGSTLVPPNIQSISGQFSGAVSFGSAGSFALTCASPCVDPTGSVVFDTTKHTATYMLASGTILESSTLYTATITGAKSLATGMKMAKPFVWSFTTGPLIDTVKPRVMTMFPATTTAVPSNLAVGAVFSTSMNPTTINSSSFTVTCSAPCMPPTGTVSYDPASASMRFVPATPLTVGATYTATISDTVTDTQGDMLAGNQAAFPAASSYVWTFTVTNPSPAMPMTLSGIEPFADATDVCPTTAVYVMLGVPSGSRVDPATVSNTTFLVTGPAPGFTPVEAASVTSDPLGTTLTFVPQSPLTPGVTYTVSLIGGAHGVLDEATPADPLDTVLATWSFTVGSSASCPTPITLGTAYTIAVGATDGITNTNGIPDTLITGDVGLPQTATCNGVTVDNAGGFGLCGGAEPVVDGLVVTDTFPGAGIVAQGLADAQAAFLSITPTSGAISGGLLGGGTAIASPMSLGGVSGSTLVAGVNYFTPGVYASTSAIAIDGDITLDAQGKPDAVFVFQSAGTLVTADGIAAPGAHTRILLINGAKASNVYWQVGSTATIGAYSEFEGTVLSASDITLKTGASVCGRVVAGVLAGGSGAVNFDSNQVSVPGQLCAP